MDTIKIKNFERDYGNGNFPTFQHLDTERLNLLQLGLLKILGIGLPVSGIELCREIYHRSITVEGSNACDENFNLYNLMSSLNLNISERVYINWYHFDDVDMMFTADLTRHLSDIWYPSSDDIEIIDYKLEWILSISHYGTIGYLRRERVERQNK